jgi:hypothetical protein
MQQKSLKILVKIFGFFMLNIYILFLKLTALTTVPFVTRDKGDGGFVTSQVISIERNNFTQIKNIIGISKKSLLKKNQHTVLKKTA